jgi:hypothetical protein
VQEASLKLQRSLAPARRPQIRRLPPFDLAKLRKCFFKISLYTFYAAGLGWPLE